MHEFTKFIRDRMAEQNMKQRDLVAGSGLSKQHVSKLYNDSRDYLGQMPDEATIEAIASAFEGVTAVQVRTAAARSLARYSDDGQPLTADLEDLPLEALLREIARREQLSREVLRSIDGVLTAGGKLPQKPDGTVDRQALMHAPERIQMLRDEARANTNLKENENGSFTIANPTDAAAEPDASGEARKPQEAGAGDGQPDNVRDLIRRNQAPEVEDPEPDFSLPGAAYTPKLGEKGSKEAREQDELADRPDPEGPEGGA